MQIRDFHNGMGRAVAERTILRKKENGEWETWQDVAYRVAKGNAALCSTKEEQEEEFDKLYYHLCKANTLMSGRHLQHGDETQPQKTMEVMTNCSTANNSFMLFLLLMSGSGVGRCYDDDIMLVNWDYAPNLRCVMDQSHPDFDFSAHESVRDAKHRYKKGKDVLWHIVEDTREGWAKALEVWENAAFQKIHHDKTLILDFSQIRPKGAPIKGMQNRPASGPVPLINAFQKAATLKGGGLPRWMQAMYVDHYFAECVLVGGARRAARMSVKSWRDQTVLDFITVKRPIEYDDLAVEDILSYRAETKFPPQGFLWSSNNSILVDKEFWRLLSVPRSSTEYKKSLAKHARNVFKLATEAAYADGTGEPGFINQDKLVRNDTGFDKLVATTNYIGSKKYKVSEDSELYLSRLLKKSASKTSYMIVNPCSEIALALHGSFCVIGDLVPYHCDSIEEFEDCAKAVTRALIRVNTMDSVYGHEVKRTNRIGVGLTGVHEFAWKFFGYGFRDLLDEEKSKDFWMVLSKVKKAIQDEAREYSAQLGMVAPHTDVTIKPAGTTSKLFGLTEGWHLPAMKWYVRWVQFRIDDPLVATYKSNGYPTRELKQYKNTVIIGFPTIPVICDLGMEDKIVTAAEATMDEQYTWLMLGEKYWIHGIDNGEPLPINTGNSISYTLKYDPEKVTYKEFTKAIRTRQSMVKCCSIMPQEKVSSYEYLPEQPVTKAEYVDAVRQIQQTIAEDVDKTHVDCASGACPIDFRK